ncbi:chemotaxis protein CheA [bacterium BMS3Abin14]|nr:chemotaxis protein CheA [bacterium BMS3Abin14]
MEEFAQVLMETFKEEAAELMAELESALLELEDSSEDMELVNRVFRALHTLKGNGAMFGFDGVSALSHHIESVYNLVREGTMPVTKELLDLTFTARDIITSMIQHPDDIDDEMEKISSDLAEMFQKLAGATTLGDHLEGASEEVKKRAGAASAGLRTYRIRFKPAPEIFLTGTNLAALLDELGSMGQCRPIAHLQDIPDLDGYDPETCYVRWDIILITSRPREEIRSVFIFLEDRCDLTIDIIDDGLIDSSAEEKRLGEILVERGDLNREDLEDVLKGRKPLGQELLDRNLVGEEDLRTSLMEQQVVRNARRRRQEDESVSSIRVASAKLDTLVDLVGELVTVQARLSQTADDRNDPELSSISEMVERLTWELRDGTFAIRMIPFGTTFSRFRRLVRDLSSEMKKEVELVTEGGETELDKTVIERLNDPLVHLIRNCVDHGIEPPDIRKTLGKPPAGKIYLSALHSGADVVIRISDDGSGLDEEAIKNRALKKGLAASNSELPRHELLSLIFSPGFSTATEVTSVSGRGVGLDVVNRSVEKLRGSIEIDSIPGQGTTFTIRLPLTLAIIEGLLVDIGDEKYVVPLSEVVECVELKAEDAAVNHGSDLAVVRGDLIPYIRLRETFKVAGERPRIEQIVLTAIHGNRIGFVVDRVIGEQQTVIKSLGKFYRSVDGISGATILGDGSVALILDVPRIMAKVESRSG